MAAAVEKRQVAGDAGPDDAAFAAEHFQQPRAQVALGELLDRLQHVAAALRGDHFAGHQVFAQFGGLKHAAADGKQPAGAAVRRIELARPARRRAMIPSSVANLPQFGET